MNMELDGKVQYSSRAPPKILAWTSKYVVPSLIYGDGL